MESMNVLIKNVKGWVETGKEIPCPSKHVLKFVSLERK